MVLLSLREKHPKVEFEKTNMGCGTLPSKAGHLKLLQGQNA